MVQGIGKGPEVFLHHVGINFGGLDVGMAHQFLDLAYLIHEFEAGVRLEFGFIFHLLTIYSIEGYRGRPLEYWLTTDYD